MPEAQPCESKTDEHATSTRPIEDPANLSQQISSGRPDAKPIYAYPLLAAGTVAISSAAVAFSSMSEISPCLLAYWRTQITLVILVPLGLHSMWQMTAKERGRMLEQAHMIFAAGILLGGFMATWVTCIENTSLPHSLIVGSAAPVIVAIGTLIRRKPISKGELIGTAIACMGMALISQSAGTEKQVTIFGDATGLMSSALYVLYLIIGRSLRSWMPLFAYVFPLFCVTTLTLCAAALSLEGASFDMSTRGLFGCFSSWHYLWLSLYLGIVPGVLGHVSFNLVLKWLHPLVIALAGCTEPVIGTAIGLALRVGHAPGVYTYAGGTVLIASTILVIVASHKREKQDAALNEACKAEVVVGLVEIQASGAEAEAHDVKNDESVVADNEHESDDEEVGLLQRDEDVETLTGLMIESHHGE